MPKRPDAAIVWAAKLAASLAQEIGLPAGNQWEPAITRLIENLRAQMSDTPVSRQALESIFRARLGLAVVS